MLVCQICCLEEYELGCDNVKSAAKNEFANLSVKGKRPNSARIGAACYARLLSWFVGQRFYMTSELA